MEILTNNEVSRHNKLIAITNIGEIAMNINELFIPFLDSAINLLFSAAQLAMSQADNVFIFILKIFNFLYYFLG